MLNSELLFLGYLNKEFNYFPKNIFEIFAMAAYLNDFRVKDDCSLTKNPTVQKLVSDKEQFLFSAIV